jgi:AcrR family transcriptional regulator
VLVRPTRDRQTERRETTRREILAAAWDVAREQGLAQLTLREVASRVGMRAPSLYSHFPSKHAIYDGMFRQAWETYEAEIDGLEDRLPPDARAALKVIAASLVDFSLADLPRHLLMNVRTIPGFEPSPESYEPAVRVIQRLHANLDRLGITDPAAADLFTALTGGLVDQQWANDPGGDRWRRLLDRVVDMYATEMGVPRPRRRTR